MGEFGALLEELDKMRAQVAAVRMTVLLELGEFFPRAERI